MNSFVKAVRSEPALISGVVLAVISLVTAFGLDLSKEQVGAIMAVVSALLAIVVRTQVTPSINVSAEKDKTGTDIAGEAAPAEIPEKAPVVVTEDVTVAGAPVATDTLPVVPEATEGDILGVSSVDGSATK